MDLFLKISVLQGGFSLAGRVWRIDMSLEGKYGWGTKTILGV